MSIPPSASGVENQDRPDVTGSEQHMENGDTKDDHLVVRGSVEHSFSGQHVVLHLRRPTTHGGGTTGWSANDRERPHAGPTAEARQTGGHTDTPRQPMVAESKKRKQAPERARVVLSDADAAEAEV